MAYGDNMMAYGLLKRNASEAEIRAASVSQSGLYQEVVTFQDGSFIELRKFNNHQAFLANGWNITPVSPAR